MSEYTPKTWEIKHAYVSHCERADWYERDIPEMAKEFDRWLTEHEAKVRDDYRGRIIDSLQENKKHLDTADPFTDGVVTAFSELIKILDSVKERADDSFATIYR